MFTKISTAALFASLVAAQAPVGGSNPTGNAIHNPLHQYVQACQPLTITWTPSTAGPVSLYLTVGDTTHSVPQDTPFAASIPNSGSYTWNVPSTLNATPDIGGYGIMIVDTVTKAYQYSPQIGIKKDACAASSSAAPVNSGYPTAAMSTGYTVSSVVAKSSTLSTACSTSTAPSYPMNNGTSTVVASTGAIPATVPVSVYPTAPAGTSAAATTSRLPQATGAASALQAGAGLVGAVAAFALMI